MARRYIHNLLIALDDLGNALINAGDPTETMSSRVGRNAIEGKKWALFLERVINWGAYLIGKQRDHCRASYRLRQTWHK